jgi:hypothetical protein
MMVGCGTNGEVADLNTRTITGATQQVSGVNVSSWAKVDARNTVQEIGVTIPLAVIQNPPAQPGSGPAGAVAVLPFPDVVKTTTLFNHFELHWSPNGHQPARLMGVPFFDFDFYTIAPQAVLQITPPDPAPPTPDRIPEGYAYPGPAAAAPQEGVLALPTAELQSTQPFTETIVAGFYGGQMVSVAPTIAQSFLQQRQAIDMLRSPRAVTIGRVTRVPNRFSATFDPATNAYQLVLNDFQTVIQ